MIDPQRKRIALVSTGGTIEKTYDELHGVMANEVSVLDVMLATLRAPRIPETAWAYLDLTELDPTRDEEQRGSAAEYQKLQISRQIRLFQARARGRSGATPAEGFAVGHASSASARSAFQADTQGMRDRSARSA